jgi:hypothetical protein
LRKGLWVGGPIPLGYATVNKKLVIVPEEAETVRTMFRLYLECGSVGARSLKHRHDLAVPHAGERVGVLPPSN